MMETGVDMNFPLESLRPQRGRELGPQDLEGHLTVVAQVVGEVHGRHAALTELALEPVAFLQCAAERGWKDHGKAVGEDGPKSEATARLMLMRRPMAA